MRKGLSRETLKSIACLTMLLDHIGYVIVYRLYLDACMVNGVDMLGAAMPLRAKQLYQFYLLLRMIGRLAFPIYCFLLVEGVHRTRSRKRYALRLALCAVLSELPYNLMTSGQLLWRQQSVMVTLLLGFGALAVMDRLRSRSWRPAAAIPFAIAAEVLMADYGWAGVAMIVLFEVSRDFYRKNLIRFLGLALLSHYVSGMVLELGNITVPMQALCALSVLFISSYDGRKLTDSRGVQLGFYLFYPVHMLVLHLLGMLL